MAGIEDYFDNLKKNDIIKKKLHGVRRALVK